MVVDSCPDRVPGLQGAYHYPACSIFHRDHKGKEIAIMGVSYSFFKKKAGLTFDTCSVIRGDKI